MSTQMLRIQTYTATSAQGVLGEANREAGYIAHIEIPNEPLWMMGSAQAVKTAQSAYMQTPTSYKHKSGKLLQRKKRKNHRCLTAGFASWPTPISSLRNNRNEAQLVKKWCQKLELWLLEQFGENLKGLVAHKDEGYFHLHFFVIGDANRIHPGLKQEFLNGQRLTSGKERHKNHVSGLCSFLDSYHQNVGAEFGLARKSENPRGPRIADRALATRLLKLEKKVAEIGDPNLLRELNNLYSAATFRTQL
jgi:hypothetical protein